MKSFTLIEILVVVSVILILSVIAIPRFRTVNSDMALDRAAYKLARDIRNIEEMSMSAKPFKSPYFPTGGYGIAFDYTNKPKSYILFADCNNNGDYDVGNASILSCSVSQSSPNAYPELIEEVFLESGIILLRATPPVFKLTFVPPDPEVKSQPSSASNPSVILYSKGKQREVSINNVGLVEIK